MPTRAELLDGLEWDLRTGNYKATETAASYYYAEGMPQSSNAWKDEKGQWWVDGNAVTEAVSQAEAEEE